jgi:hypothetical protein
MATVSEIEDMSELRAFLTGRYVQTGHPYEAQEKDLEKALNVVITNIRGQTAALRVIKAALAEDDGWLMLVLRDHASDPEFKRVEKVCAEIRDTFSLRTSDSRAPDDAVRGDWQEVDGDSELYLEVYEYKELRRKLSSYEYFVGTAMRKRLVELGHDMQTHYSLHAQKRLPQEYQDEWDALDALERAISRLPGGSQVVRGAFLGDPKVFMWQLQSSYLEYSESSPLSRSWLLANVPVAARALKVVAKRTDALLPHVRMEHTKMVKECLRLLSKWEELAKAQLQVPFAAREARETGGAASARAKRKKPGQGARLPQLLDALLNVYH